MNWQIVPAGGGLGEHRAAWDRLGMALAAGQPVLSGRFVDALLQHTPDSGALLCVARDEQQQVQGLCLLRQQQDGSWASFLRPGAPLGPALLPADTDLAGLLASLPGSASQLELLAVDTACAPETLLGQPLANIASHAMAVTLDLRDAICASWAAVQGTASSADVETPRVVVHTEATAMAAALQRADALGAWPDRLPLYTTLLAAWAADGGARIVELWLGDSVLAAQPLLAGSGHVVALEAWQADAAKHQDIGALLLRGTFEHALQAWPGWRLEFHGPAARAHLAHASGCRHIVRVRVQRKPAGLLAQVRSALLPPGARSNTGGAPLVEVHDHLHQLPADVLALFAVGEACRVSLGAHWLRLLADTALEPRAQPRVYVLRANGRPLAALPTLQYPGTGRLEALSNYYTVMYGPVFEPGLDSAALVPLVHTLLKRPGAPAVLQFGPLDPLDPGFTMLRESLRRAGLATFAYFAHGNWYLPVVSDWPTYFGGRTSVIRNNVKRMGRKLEAAGGRLEIVSTPEGAEAGIKAYEHVYARSWKNAEPHPAFMPGLIRLCAQRGWLRLGVAWLGEVPVAAQLWIVANGRAEIYKIAYDEAYKALAPGTLLTTELMRHAYEVDRVREVDYLIGDDPYKAQWMTHRRERLGLVAYNLRSVRGLLLAGREIGGRLLKRLRKEPAAA